MAQYQAQALSRGPLRVAAANGIALLALPFLVLRWLRAGRPKAALQACRYLKIDAHMAYGVPLAIQAQTLEAEPREPYFYLQDLLFPLRLFVRERRFNAELCLKIMAWMARVRPQLDRFHPEFLIQYCEYSAFSSLRKAFLNQQGIGLANIAHGEEFIGCRSAFSTFDQYFAWHLTPQALHHAMHIEDGEFYTFNPCERLPSAPPPGNVLVIGILWPSQPGVDLPCLADQIKRLAARVRVIVRPHPNPIHANGFETWRPSLGAEVSDPGIHRPVRALGGLPVGRAPPGPVPGPGGAVPHGSDPCQGVRLPPLLPANPFGGRGRARTAAPLNQGLAG